MSNYFNSSFFVAALFFIASCQNPSGPTDKTNDGDKTLFTLINPSESGILFSNDIIESVRQNVTNYDYYYNGSGLAVGDINNDGLDDIFFAGNKVSNKLYLNKGNLKFEDITEKSGLQSILWSTGVTMVDINNDGYLDIYVCNSAYADKKDRINRLYINNGDLTFSEKAAEYGIANSGYSSQASFFDYDRDGDLDLFVMNHSVFQILGKWTRRIENMSLEEKYDHSPNLYRNNGDNTYTDISQQAGILKPSFGLGLITADLNHDGWIDIYVANDYFLPDYYYLNNQKGSFDEVGKKKTGHTSYFSMGADAADFNNDGLLDIGVVDMTPGDHVRNKVLMSSMNVDQFNALTNKYNYQYQYMFNSLQLNIGDGLFSEIGLYADIARTDWSWGALFADFDNDGLKDFLVTNGFRKDTKNNDWRMKLNEIIRTSTKENLRQRKFEHLQSAESNPVVNYIFKNNGEYAFEDKSYDWGFRDPSFSNGVVYADLDLDGDLDIVMNNIDKEAFLFENNAEKLYENNFIRFKIFDQSGKQPAYNAKVTIYHGDKMQYAEQHPVRGYLSCVESDVHFGLNNISVVDSVKVEWLNGSKRTLKNLAANKAYDIKMGNFDDDFKESQDNDPVFKHISSSVLKPAFVHEENEYDDFSTEVLLPHRQSMLGPFISVGDVNGDQLEDFFIGGAKNQSGQLYIQNSDGTFDLSSDQVWEEDAGCEDMGSLLFDCDGDGDLDLYVSSGGGGEFRIDDPQLADRIYINNGQGIFIKKENAIPSIYNSSGIVKGADFDNDGDIDLFVAGRTTPGKYPHPTNSYILKNDGGKFYNVTNEAAPDLINMGMVTDAVWVDNDNDGKQDLLVVGEWMPITYLKNTGTKFEDHTKQMNLNEMRGWWSSIIAGDFDSDGDEDYIVGNIGKNNKFKPSKEKPLHIFCNDFDDNGSLDIVLSKKYKNALVPVRGKECSTSQMPFVSEKFPSYKAFSESTLEEIYSKEKLDLALHYTANLFQSIYLENKNGKGFQSYDLPAETQFAPVNAIISEDFNQDGITDLLLAGNYFQTEVETPRYDAGKGLFLSGNGDGTFATTIRVNESGVLLPFDVKDMELITIGKDSSTLIIVANNNDSIQFLKVMN